MARPRKSDSDLPANVYFKHGAYYHVQGGRWVRLTSERANVDLELAALSARVPATMQEIAAYAQKQVSRSRANAKGRRNLPHDLTAEQVLSLLWKAEWRCAVTATPFSLLEVGPRRQRPFAPSIDRIDNDKGYTLENCRMVCVVTNLAMNAWGEDALRQIASNMRNAKSVRQP